MVWLVARNRGRAWEGMSSRIHQPAAYGRVGLVVNIVPGDYVQLIIGRREGMSGGGVFNDQGDLMGIALGPRTRRSTIGELRADRLKGFLNKGKGRGCCTNFL